MTQYNDINVKHANAVLASEENCLENITFSTVKDVQSDVAQVNNQQKIELCKKQKMRSADGSSYIAMKPNFLNPLSPKKEKTPLQNSKREKYDGSIG